MGKVIAFNRNPIYDDRIVEFFDWAVSTMARYL